MFKHLSIISRVPLMKETCGGDGEQGQKRDKVNLKRGKGQIIPEPLQAMICRPYFMEKRKTLKERSMI